MERKDIIILSKEGLYKTFQSRSNRCVGKCLGAIEALYKNKQYPAEIDAIKNLIKNVIHEEFRDLHDLLAGEYQVLYSNYKGDTSLKKK